jgi:hypothetical protein
LRFIKFENFEPGQITLKGVQSLADPMFGALFKFIQKGVQPKNFLISGINKAEVLGNYSRIDHICFNSDRELYEVIQLCSGAETLVFDKCEF